MDLMSRVNTLIHLLIMQYYRKMINVLAVFLFALSISPTDLNGTVLLLVNTSFSFSKLVTTASVVVSSTPSLRKSVRFRSSTKNSMVILFLDAWPFSNMSRFYFLGGFYIPYSVWLPKR